MIALLLLLLTLAPVCPVDDVYISSEYGMRKHPISKQKKKHQGIDFAAIAGTPVRSIWPGRVVKSRGMRGGFGRLVIVETRRIRVLYAHLSSRSVVQGDVVSAGDVVGLVGESGVATGAHLHLGLFWRGRPRDPGGLLALCLRAG